MAEYVWIPALGVIALIGFSIALMLGYAMGRRRRRSPSSKASADVSSSTTGSDSTSTKSDGETLKNIPKGMMFAVFLGLAVGIFFLWLYGINPVTYTEDLTGMLPEIRTLLVVSVLALIILLFSKDWRVYAGSVLALLILGYIAIAYNTSIDSFVRLGERCANAECSYDADDYPVYNGGVMRLKSGEARTVWIEGKVRVPNSVCHNIQAEPEVHMTENAGAENIFLEPLSGLSRQLVTVRKEKWFDHPLCEKYWSERGMFF